MSMIQRFKEIVGDQHVLTGDDMAPSLTDWRGRYTGKALAVVLPGSTDEVSRVVALCAEQRIPIVPQGGNTGLVGGATPDETGAAIVLCLRRMNRIEIIDSANYTMQVEAGCLLADVQNAALAANRLFPLSLAAEGSCTIGGNIATNAGGVQVLRYGTMRELVLGLEVVLPDGRVWTALNALRKNNTGYDLKHLFIGSEGTLGIVTRAVLKLFPRPKAQMVAWLSVPDPAAAVAVFSELQEHCGGMLCAFELMSRPVLDLYFSQAPDRLDPLPGSPWAILVELSGSGALSSALENALEEALAKCLSLGLVHDAVLAQSDSQCADLWAIREEIPGAEKRDGAAIKHDISVPVSAIPEFLREAEARIGQDFPEAEVLVFGHVGDGNLHYNVRHRHLLQRQQWLERSESVNHLVFGLVHEMGGAISAEHGIGQLRATALCQCKSPVEINLMSKMRQLIDSAGIMNPGKIFVASTMDS